MVERSGERPLRVVSVRDDSHVLPRIPDDIYLLLLDFDFESSFSAPVFNVLSPDERHRASQFMRREDAVRFAATRAALRNCLGEALGVPAASLRFSRFVAGRPMLTSANATAEVDFNVSHSGAHALIAWSLTRRVGVDIEQRRARWAWRPLVSTVCGASDVATLESAPPAGRADLFFDMWVAKEALLKAHGAGIPAGLTHFSVLGQGSLTPRISGRGELADTLEGFESVWLRAIDGYAACLAWSP